MGRTSHMDASKVVIQMKDIVKKFGDFTANDHINLSGQQRQLDLQYISLQLSIQQKASKMCFSMIKEW